MAKIPPLRRMRAEDFPDQNEWIGRILEPINTYFEANTAALNKGLTLDDNFAAAIKTVEIDGNFPVRISWDLSVPPKTVLVGAVRLASGATADLFHTPGIQWSYNQSGQLQIDAVFGILPAPVNFLDSAVATSTEKITIPAHPFETADKVTLSTTGTLPAGLSAGTYYIIKDGLHTVILATSPTNARAGTAVNITAAAGGGIHIITPQYSTKYRLILECKVG